MTNEPYPALVIKKTAGNNGKPLESVKFLVAKPNGEQIGIYKTDKSGRIEIEGLDENMVVFAQVLPTVPKDYKIVNRADVGGRYGNEWESKNTSWNTSVWAEDTPRVPLPKTGY